MKAKEVMNVLRCTRQTLCSYVKSGKIQVTKMSNGQYIYDENSVYKMIGLKKQTKKQKIVSYARVSTNAQKQQLKDQSIRIYNSCISKGICLDIQIEDIKSGMSADRAGFNKLCEMIIKGEVKMLVIENKDRLVRFGFEMFEHFFKYFGCSILVLNDSIDNKTYEQELTEDLISVIHYFTMKSDSYRRKLNKLRKEIEDEANW